MVYLGNDQPCNISDKGECALVMEGGTTLMMNDVRHVPNLRRNLTSIGQLTDSGYKVTFEHGSYKVSKGALVVAHSKREGSLFIANGKIDHLIAAGQKTSSNVDCMTWHRRLGHMSEKGMQIMVVGGSLPGLSKVN